MTISSIDVGQPGKCHEAMVFKMSDLWVASGGCVWHIVAKPEYHILGDGAYPTKSYLLKPFRDDGDLTQGQQKYNMTHSTVRSIVERAIGRLKGRFRTLHFLDVRAPDKAKKIIVACCVLHNFAILKNDLIEDEETDDNDGCDTMPTEEVDALYGIDDLGVDKHQRIMCALSEFNSETPVDGFCCVCCCAVWCTGTLGCIFTVILVTIHFFELAGA